jgi:hypothetical protein
MNNQWKMVPVEPTVQMEEAAAPECGGYCPRCDEDVQIKTGMQVDIYRAMLAAAPVPPAGDVEVIQAFRSVVGGINGLSWEYSSKLNLPAPSKHGEVIELVDRAHVTRLTAERDEARRQVQLLNEAGEFLDDVSQGVEDKLRAENATLQSELTKARELLNTLYGASLEMLRIAGIANQGSKAYNRAITNLHESVTSVAARQAATPIAHNVDESCGQDAEAAKTVFNDPLYNAESDARNAAAMLEEVLEFYDDGVGRSAEEFKLMRKIGGWLGRSVAEIEHETDECAHSEANKIGCPECAKVFKP